MREREGRAHFDAREEKKKRSSISSDKTQTGRRLSFALARRASTGALTGSRAELLIAFFLSSAVEKRRSKSEKSLVRERERGLFSLSRVFFGGIGRAGRGGIFSSTSLFSFPKQDGLHGPLLHVPPRRRADRSDVPRRGRVRRVFGLSSRKKRGGKNMQGARGTSIDTGEERTKRHAEKKKKKNSTPPPPFLSLQMKKKTHAQPGPARGLPQPDPHGGPRRRSRVLQVWRRRRRRARRSVDERRRRRQRDAGARQAPRRRLFPPPPRRRRSRPGGDARQRQRDAGVLVHGQGESLGFHLEERKR